MQFLTTFAAETYTNAKYENAKNQGKEELTVKKVRRLFAVCVCLLGMLYLLSSVEAQQQMAEQILSATGIKGGLIVHIGCGDGRLTAALHASESYLVHGLDADPVSVQKAREHIRSLGLYGKISVELFAGEQLPYTDNLVNLVVSENLGQVPMDEVMRVLCPDGAAYIKEDGEWVKTVKPRPREIDEWTHALHDSTNNAVANDSVVGPPHHIQWVGGPKWARSHDHLASVSVVVSSGGRIFYIVDEGPNASVALPSRWFLAARDAFNGVILWKQPIESWEGELRGFRSGPPELSRRLIAVNDRVYVTLGYGVPVTALDAATGEIVRSYEGTDGATEIVYHDGVLFVVIGDRDADEAAEAAKRRGAVPPPREKRILAIKADTGDLLWKKADSDTSELMPTALCVDGGRVFFQNISEVICLGAMSGGELWRAPRPISTNRLGWSTPTLVVHDDVLISADRDPTAAVSEEEQAEPGKVLWVVSVKGGNAPVGKMIAFSARTGEVLWTSPCREVYNSPVDVLISDGLVWSGDLVRARDPGITMARDLLTGQVRRQRPSDDAFFKVGMGHHRCYKNKATSKYLVMGRSGTEFIDLATGRGIANHWVRGTCQYGVMPCNGLLYAPPHSCACYITSKLNGFNALAPKREPRPAQQGEVSRFERGPAYGQIENLESETEKPGDWPTYRHDPARSGNIASAVPAALENSWKAQLGGKLTSPVVAEGKVFVASVDTHTVHALDANSGEVVWSYTAGGRVDSPPTIHKGMALFGSADGHVYCLRASDGELVWRFQAAPEDRRVVSYGQLESTWPVHGSVLVQDGKAYFAAGRSSFLDGGIYLYKLDPATGKRLAQRRIDSRDRQTGEQPKGIIRGTNMIETGSLPDVLSSDGTSVYMRHVRFDRNGVQQDQTVPHLYSSVGFLDDSWWHRTYWIVGTEIISGWGGWPRIGNQIPAGRILVCDETSIYGFGRDQYATHGSHVGLGRTHYQLFSAARSPKLVEEVDRRGNKAKVRKPDYHWTQQIPLTVRAMVLAGKTLFLAGPPGQDAEGLAGIDGSKGGVLWAISAEGGEKLTEYRLDSVPVFDGMIAANGRLYLTSKDGNVLCFAGSN